MEVNLHSLQGGFAMAMLTIGSVLLLLCLAEWLEYRRLRKEKKKQFPDL